MKKKSSGTVLMLVMVFMIIMSILGLAVIYIFSVEEMSARAEIVTSRAVYLANGGIGLTEGWLIKQQIFPEWVNHNTSGFIPSFVPYSIIYPDDGITGKINIFIQPYPANNVNLAGDFNSSVDGFYTIVSSGIIPGIGYDTIKNVSSTLYISTKTWDIVTQSSFTYKAKYGSWRENPIVRIYH